MKHPLAEQLFDVPGFIVHPARVKGGIGVKGGISYPESIPSFTSYQCCMEYEAYLLGSLLDANNEHLLEEGSSLGA